MKNLFSEIMAVDDVKGAMLFSINGDVVYQEFVGQPPSGLTSKNLWTNALKAFKGVKESEIVFENCRMYVRETKLGFLLILMELYVPIALIRLNCDMLVSSLDTKKAPKGRWGLFKKRN